MNLTICLLSSRRFLTREQIRQAVEGYHGLTDEAFERSFERDKDELRALGVPIEVGSYDAFFNDEQGYRIVRSDFELPAVSFAPDEANVLGAAMTVWHQTRAAEKAAKALAKLRAAGINLDLSRLAALSPEVSAEEPAFDVLWPAVFNRTPMRFRYREGEIDRVVEPWRLAWRKGRWYLLGFDRSRKAPRLFKLSRITSTLQPAGKPGSYEIPDQDMDALISMLFPGQTDSSALVAIREGRAPQLRRMAERRDGEVFVGYELWQVPYASDRDFVRMIASLGTDAIVYEPESLRNAVRAHLEGIAALEQGGTV